MMNALTCHACGRVIGVGTYLTSGGKAYHDACYRDHVAPRCAHCGRSVGELPYLSFNDRPYHKRCYDDHIVPRCDHCGQPMRERYFTDSWGGQYCRVCSHVRPRCRYCGRRAPGGGDGTSAPVCGPCRTAAVVTLAEAKARLRPVLGWLAGQGLSVHRGLKLRVELRDAAEMNPVGDGTIRPLGLANTWQRTVAGEAITGREPDRITLQRGLPVPLFEAVGAHEIGHFWLAAHRVRGLSKMEEEGFCQLLSHRYVQSLSSPEARYHVQCIEVNTDPIYGEGFRRVRALTDAIGLPRLLVDLRTTGHMPRPPR